MPSIYQIVSEFTSDKDPDSLSVTPTWEIAVIRFAQPLTLSRAKLLASETSVSRDANSEDLIKERSVLVIADDILQMHIEHTKSSYIGSLQATLAAGANYLQEIQPNDWVFAWIHNDESKGRSVIDRIFKGDACNNFDDGLKFVGRVQSIRKHLTQGADGRRSVRYQLQANSFKELDSTIFFDPALVKEEESIGKYLTEMGVDLDEVFATAGKNSGGLTTTLAVPRLLKLLIGEGIPPSANSIGDIQIVTGGTSTKEAPYAYAVPTSVLDLLGQPHANKPVPSYSDVLELVLGVQKYLGGAASNPTDIFTPLGAANKPTNYRILNDKLLGSFLPMPISFTGKSVWGFLEEFKNPAVNEMYTALRVNPEGRVVPTIICRQLPFSTEGAVQTDPDNLTGHLELPRWNAHPILINSLDIGKSDALHINFIHVYGQASADAGVTMTEQIIQNPPIRDEQDIKRSGLRMHMQTINCSIDDTLDEPSKWMKISADFLLGQQYTLTGTCEMIGISAPICPGDNFEFDDTVYHIEAVSHSCSIQEGIKSFSTTVSLTHGMRSDTPKAGDDSEFQGGDSELRIYSGMRTTDNLGHNPEKTIDTRHPLYKQVNVDG